MGQFTPHTGETPLNLPHNNNEQDVSKRTAITNPMQIELAPLMYPKLSKEDALMTFSMNGDSAIFRELITNDLVDAYLKNNLETLEQIGKEINKRKILH